MVASIDVLSGKRTILDYFWQPISKTKIKPFESKTFGTILALSVKTRSFSMQVSSQIDQLIHELNEFAHLSNESDNDTDIDVFECTEGN